MHGALAERDLGHDHAIAAHMMGMTKLDQHGNVHRPSGAPDGGQFSTKANSAPTAALTAPRDAAERERFERLGTFYAGEYGRVSRRAYELDHEAQSLNVKAFVAEMKSIDPRAAGAVFRIDDFEDSVSFHCALDADGNELELDRDPDEVMSMSVDSFVSNWGHRDEAHPDGYVVRFENHELDDDVTPEMTARADALKRAGELDGPHGVFAAAIARTLEHNPAAAERIRNLTAEEAERLYVDYLVPALDDVLDHLSESPRR